MQTFDVTKKYNKEDFTNFLSDFLPDDFEQNEEELYADFKNIKTGFRLGECKSLDLTIFEFSVVSANDPRVTLTREVCALMKKYESNSNALAVFYNTENSQWRFSLITTDYETDKKGNNKPLYSNPKRFSFALGEGCKRHTPESMLFEKGTVKATKDKTALDDLKSRFAIEVVSDKFFDEYKVFYEDFVQFITGNRYIKKSNKWEKVRIHDENKTIFNQFKEIAKNENGKLSKEELITLAQKYVRDYIKKLMGRLVFLQFLQKKGWLGVPEKEKWGNGDKNYLIHLFENSSTKNQENFLDAVLEPLFFNTLNQKRKNDFAAPVLETGNGRIKIPYLNGGLFENDELTDKINIRFPKELFSNPSYTETERTFIQTKDYPYTESCGLLDFFTRYNFTIDETDPTDLEIGVDPEMLGKIFENLLEDNKDKGAFYTPKEIVQYMCRESLIAYLATDSKIPEEKIRSFVTNPVSHYDSESLLQNQKKELLIKLKAVKVCDPAVGSGAFPMGMLNCLYACRSVLENFDDVSNIKKQIVQENIYGVDIEKGAVDIARLRFWLAIIVDEKEPMPLPNLDYKIMQGNSLLESYNGIDLSKILVKPKNGEMDYNEEARSKIQKTLNEYFDITDHKEKETKNLEVKQQILDLVLQTCGIKHLDIIKNPSPKDAENFNNVCTAIYGMNSPFFLWHTWFSDVFNRPSDCNTFNGFDIVIGNPPYISAPTQIANKMLAEQREKLVTAKKFNSLYQKWDLYIPFIEMGVRYLCRENGICTMIVPYPLTNQLYAKELRKILTDEFNMFELVDLNGTKVFESATVSNCIPLVQKAKPKHKTWISNIDGALQIHKSFEQTRNDFIQNEKNFVWNVTQEKREKNRHANMHVLGDYCYISVGMVLNADEKTAKGEFSKDDLISEIKDKIHCRKYIEAKDIEKYMIKNIRYLEYNTARVPNKLRRPTFRELYEQNKLMFNRLGSLQVILDTEKLLHSDSMFSGVLWYDLSKVENKSISSSIKKFSTLSRQEMEKLSKKVDLRYLLGIMNSKYASVLLTNLRGGDYHIYPEHIRNIPIPTATSDQQAPIIALVDKIIAKKKSNQSADTSAYERKIDLYVYKLYELSFEEAKTIDSSLTQEEFESVKVGKIK